MDCRTTTGELLRDVLGTCIRDEKLCPGINCPNLGKTEEDLAAFIAVRPENDCLQNLEASVNEYVNINNPYVCHRRLRKKVDKTFVDVVYHDKAWRCDGK